MGEYKFIGLKKHGVYLFAGVRYSGRENAPSSPCPFPPISHLHGFVYRALALGPIEY